jgi:hypothetical protein
MVGMPICCLWRIRRSRQRVENLQNSPGKSTGGQTRQGFMATVMLNDAHFRETRFEFAPEAETR